MPVPPSGPPDAKILICGEAPGDMEVMRQTPFVGPSGMELDRMLHEAGIARSQCFCTNVCREQPPGNEIDKWFSQNKNPPKVGTWVPAGNAWVHPHVRDGLALLTKEIALVKPKLIFALGNTALWALCGKRGITDWRGSTLPGPEGTVVVPSYHPAGILRNYSWRSVAVHDLKRGKRVLEEGVHPPPYQFTLRPTLGLVVDRITSLLAQAREVPLKLAVDIETRAGHIACLGFAWSATEALCIPFMCLERKDGYWAREEEVIVVRMLQQLLTHPNVQVIGQNWSYDTQYIQRWLGFTAGFARDTMLAHHVCWPGMPKGLDFLSSMYCRYHVFWKAESKEWHHQLGEDQLWAYNCKDCVITYEVDDALQAQVDRMGLREQHDFQQGMFWPVTAAVTRGLRDDPSLRGQFAKTLNFEMKSREAWFQTILGHPLNPRSPQQMKRLFFEDLAQKVILNRKTGTSTLDEEALEVVGRREPLLRPLIRRISEHRSLAVFLSTFVNARVDTDSRIRCSFNIAGAETFRLSSAQNAFGSGLNLQNIPQGGETEKGNPNALVLPNVRQLFIPDPGYEIFDLDLRKADLHVVAWESRDEGLQQMLLEGIDVFVEASKLLGCTYHLAKSWVHGTNYGGGPRTMAINCGLTVHVAEKYQRVWFEAHPAIPKWHRRVEESLRTKRTLTNAFGYRRFFFDRVEGILPEALGWVPQSTVARVINGIWWNIAATAPQVEVLIQVHDSLVGQFPSGEREPSLELLRQAAQVTVPYANPLVIPVAIKTSRSSWGECQ